jgi:hypothetical protein
MVWLWLDLVYSLNDWSKRGVHDDGATLILSFEKEDFFIPRRRKTEANKSSIVYLFLPGVYVKL